MLRRKISDSLIIQIFVQTLYSEMLYFEVVNEGYNQKCYSTCEDIFIGAYFTLLLPKCILVIIILLTIFYSKYISSSTSDVFFFCKSFPCDCHFLVTVIPSWLSLLSDWQAGRSDNPTFSNNWEKPLGYNNRACVFHPRWFLYSSDSGSQGVC